MHGANNWSNPINLEKRALQNHEVRVKVLNDALKDFGVNVEVSLADHWPYQRLRYKLGDEKNLRYLSLLALRNPWEWRIASKLKTVLTLWLEMLGLGSSRV